MDEYVVDDEWLRELASYGNGGSYYEVSCPDRHMHAQGIAHVGDALDTLKRVRKVHRGAELFMIRRDRWRLEVPRG